MAIDFKVNFLEGENNIVNITSSNKSKLTSGIFALSQKVLHGLLTSIGEDYYDINWGGNLLTIFKIPILPSNRSKVYSAVKDSLSKVKKDIIRDQSKIPDLKEESLLVDLILIDVFPDIDNQVWKVDFSVVNGTGDRFPISLP